jgi:DNA-binding SARP family transcriptional activator
MILTLHIHLLGDFLLVSGETPVTTVNVPRLQSLLAYLVLHRTAPQARSHLAFLLWPDSTEDQARAYLRQLLYQLRQALPDADHFLRVDTHHLQWLPEHSNTTWTLDILDVEQALAQAEQAEQAQDMTALRKALEQVVHLYHADLLPSCYDEWILPERDRVRQLFFSAAERLIALLEQEREYGAAIKVAQQLLRHDLLHEAAYCQLMRFSALRGERTAALRVYHTCVTILERELATAPSEATRQAYEALLHMNTASTQKCVSVSPPAGIPLVGRKQEWGHLQTAWRRAASGYPHLVVLCGEAGIGKTKLAEELLAWVSQQGMTAASTRCYAVEGRLAYAPVTSWLRANAIQAGLSALDPVWLTEGARLVPDLLTRHADLPHPRPMREGWQRQQFFEALARAVLVAPQPLLLLLDDLHWCDTETLEWLHYLLRFEPKARLLLLGTVCSEETLPAHPLVAFMGALQRDGLVTEVTLGPLTPAETTSLAEHIMGHQLDPIMSTRLYRETEGNPLFVVEMMRAGTWTARGGEPDVVDTSHPLLTRPVSMLPPTIQTVLAARLAHLSPAARELANLAAVIGSAFSFAVLVCARKESEESLVQGLDELWQRRIVHEQDVGGLRPTPLAMTSSESRPMSP